MVYTGSMGAVFIKKLSEVSIKDVPEVGGKNASLGEMIQELTKKKGIPVPGGYVVTATAYRQFLKETGLDVFIKKTLEGLDTKKIQDLAKRGKAIREKIVGTQFPEDLKEAVKKA